MVLSLISTNEAPLSFPSFYSLLPHLGVLVRGHHGQEERWAEHWGKGSWETHVLQSTYKRFPHKFGKFWITSTGFFLMLLLTTFVVFPSPYLVVLFLLTKKISYIAEWQNLMKFYCLLSCFSSFFVDLLLGILDYLHEARKNFSFTWSLVCFASSQAGRSACLQLSYCYKTRFCSSFICWFFTLCSYVVSWLWPVGFLWYLSLTLVRLCRKIETAFRVICLVHTFKIFILLLCMAVLFLPNSFLHTQFRCFSLENYFCIRLRTFVLPI